MIADEVEQLARRLYDRCSPVKPAWDQLGEITKSVWREQAAEQLSKDLL